VACGVPSEEMDGNVSRTSSRRLYLICMAAGEARMSAVEQGLARPERNAFQRKLKSC
jgi:hypothetical protein